MAETRKSLNIAQSTFNDLDVGIDVADKQIWLGQEIDAREGRHIDPMKLDCRRVSFN